MEEFTDIQCPFCSQTFEVVVDTSLAQQVFTTDCEICCRPLEVVAVCKDGKIVSVEVRSE